MLILHYEQSCCFVILVFRDLVFRAVPGETCTYLCVGECAAVSDSVLLSRM